jgi:hypothetical protein
LISGHNAAHAARHPPNRENAMSQRILLHIAAGLVLVHFAIVPAASLAAPPPTATCAAAEKLSLENRQLIAKAAEGGAELRRYVWRTKPIYNRDLSEVVPWLEQREQAARSGCAAAQAQADRPIS